MITSEYSKFVNEYNNTNKQYCTLDVIQVGTHEANPKQVECTDCQSFELK